MSESNHSGRANRASRDMLHLWTPCLAHFAGGVTVFGREVVGALVASQIPMRLFGKLDPPGSWEGQPLHGVGNLPTWLRTPAYALLLLWHCWKERPQLIVSTHCNFGPVAHWARRLYGTRFVLVAHGVEVSERLSRRRLAALKSADRVWAVSQWTRQRLVRLGVQPDRITILSNTVDELRFTTQPPATPSTLPSLRHRYGIRPDAKVVLTVARLSAEEGYKGYDVILRCLPGIRRIVGDVHYVLCGQGTDLPRLQNLVRELGLSACVTLAGFVPPDELADHYRLADVFAMPSMGEGFGIVFLEAMACGRPVLAGNQDGSCDALAGGDLGKLVPPRDTEAITQGMADLLRQRGPTFWYRPDQLRARMLQCFGRDQFQRKVAELVRESPVACLPPQFPHRQWPRVA